ncbi:methyl-accepting chemotaxis protein [Paenibacillus soyae]|uniref:Methyl-accepting chemotaxis protein n=1 Tax=Paenibacillus soyae TaxID=2969249 RepID=A0A9X2MXX2_9BACL|nr:methyl-accepting chemotaxis protein [Paenibacillus soyae]MCR2805467.1 methyl-accepting chemotaxis protein [Paenibacillus soyae]
MRKNGFWSSQSIGRKYGYIFTIVMLLFILSVAVTFGLLTRTKTSVEQTRVENEVVIEVSELMSLYQEKYLFVPEFILDNNNKRLLLYLELSDQFVDTAKGLKGHLTTDEQVDLFDQMIENNHKLDEYFFSQIVPHVQNINTEKFVELQSAATRFKEDTMALGDALKQKAIASNQEAIERSGENINSSISTLVISVVISFVISIVLILSISRSIRRRLLQVVTFSDAIASGNLNIDDLPDQSQSEIGQLSKSINHMKASLKEMIHEISALSGHVDHQVLRLTDTSDGVREQSEQVATTVEELAGGASSLAEEAHMISENMKQFYENITGATSNGERLVRFSQEVLTVSIDGSNQMTQSLEQMNTITETVQRLVDKIKDLEQQTSAITDFVGSIRSIAKQTNLLALNAAIEAARAGEAGKGFAVVATEVRKLAEEAGKSSDSITRIVGTINAEIMTMTRELDNGFQEVSKGKQQIETSGQYFFDIKEKVSTMSQRIDDISETLVHLGEASDGINQSVEHIASISEQSAAGAEEISATATEQKYAMQQVSNGANELRELVERMNKLIARFHI